MVALIGRFFRLITLRLIPLIILVGIFWSGYQVAQAVIRQVEERNEIEDRLDSFPGTATVIAMSSSQQATKSPAVEPEATEEITLAETVTPVQINATAEVTPEPAVLIESPEPTIEEVEPSATNTETAQPTEADTLTPIPSEPATETPTAEPSATETESPTVTDAPTETATEEPTETELPTETATDTETPTSTTTPSATASATPTEDVSNRFQATNTPQSMVFVTNTPVGQEAPPPTATETAIPVEPTIPPTDVPPTNTDVPPTDTAIPPTPIPPTATPTEEPVVAATQPLPTYLAPREGEAGQIINGTAVPTSVPLIPRDNQPLVNIILLGGDDELTSDGSTRTDTMIIVSINRDNNTVSMLSLPRDLFVYIPTVNGAMERLNVVYGFGEAIGWTDGGFGLLRQTIAYNFGINVHYYAKVNFSGFNELIDILGGVEIAVDCPYQDYALIGAEVPEGAEIADDEGLRTLDVGVYEMSGAQALWYARTRQNSSDFDRGRRQQQLLRAIWRKGINSLSITNAPQLYDQMLNIVETDMGINEFISLIPIALNLDVDRIRSFTLIRTYHTTPWQPPDGAFVQLPIYETMRPLLEDFYRPPNDSQLLVEGATIEVVNGTTNEDWDQVAAERLGYEGFRAGWGSVADNTDYEQTILIDYTGESKGTSRTEIAQILNIAPTNIQLEPDPNRTADFRVILGQNYNSCNVGGVLPIEG